MRKVLSLSAAAVLLAGCATPVRYVKPGADRHSVAIDALECHKQGVIAHRSSLMRTSAANPNARQKANQAARGALERCAKSRGYRRAT